MTGSVTDPLKGASFAAQVPTILPKERPRECLVWWAPQEVLRVPAALAPYGWWGGGVGWRCEGVGWRCGVVGWRCGVVSVSSFTSTGERPSVDEPGAMLLTNRGIKPFAVRFPTSEEVLDTTITSFSDITVCTIWRYERSRSHVVTGALS